MNKRIRSLIDAIFSEMKMTAENLALRDELMANAQARYEDMIALGKTEEEAFADVAASLEDVSELLSEMNADQPAAKADAAAPAEEDTETEDAGAQETDLGDALNKAFTALGTWGQSIMPQAKKLAKQMDSATGGMLRDIGRAVNKGMLDAQKAASEVLDKFEQEKAAEINDDFKPDDLPRDPEALREDAMDLRAQASLKRAVGDEAGASALEAQAEAMENHADALMQAEAIELARQAAEADGQEEAPAKDEQPEAPIFGADGELDEEAFAKSVEQMSRDAEQVVRSTDETFGGTHDPLKNEIRFPVAGLRRIDAKLDADDVSVEPTEGDEIIVRWDARNVENEPSVTMHNHTLTIRRKNPDVFKTFFSVFSKDGGKITICVPKGYAADYVLSTTSGDQHLSGLDVDNVRMATSSGSIRLEPDLQKRASDIKVETISGDITVSAMAGSIDAHSVSGDVFISCDAASVKGDVVSGKLHIEGACDNWDVNAVSGRSELICTVVPTGKVSADTLSGSVTLYLPSTIRGFAVAFDAISGSLTNEFGPDRFGTGSLPIRLNTISGKMTISRL